MKNKISMIDFGDASKPLTDYTDKKISNAGGILYEPTQIKRKAKAEAKATKIKATASMKISAIEQRGIDRLIIRQEGRKQDNMESIIDDQALPKIAKTATVETVKALDEDWLAHFFKGCDTVSDKAMQSLWFKLLSSEATKPGTFSKRTLSFVATMDKKEARCSPDFVSFAYLLMERILSHSSYISKTAFTQRKV